MIGKWCRRSLCFIDRAYCPDWNRKKVLASTTDTILTNNQWINKYTEYWQNIPLWKLKKGYPKCMLSQEVIPSAWLGFKIAEIASLFATRCRPAATQKCVFSVASRTRFKFSANSQQQMDDCTSNNTSERRLVDNIRTKPSLLISLSFSQLMLTCHHQ